MSCVVVESELDVVVALALAAVVVDELVEELDVNDAAIAEAALAWCFACAVRAWAAWWAADKRRRSSSDSIKAPEDLRCEFCATGRVGP